MAKVDVSVVTETLTAAGVPVITVRLTHAQAVEVEFANGVTDEQKAAAQTILASFRQEVAQPGNPPAPAVNSRAPKK